MAMDWEGGSYTPKKKFIKLDGNKIFVENTNVYDGSIHKSYRIETILYFNDNESAAEYYYKYK